MKDSWDRFDKKDYLKGFRSYIKASHILFNYALKKYKIKGKVLDIGGGPALSTEMLDNKTVIYNIEPAKNCLIKKRNYHPINLRLKKAIELNKVPKKLDNIITCTALHEIALSNKLSNDENKKIMYKELNNTIENLKKGGLVIIVFIEYIKNVKKKDIKRHLWIAENTVGHDHPPEEFVSMVGIKRNLKGLKLIETKRILQKHRYKKFESKIIWSKLAVFRK